MPVRYGRGGIRTPEPEGADLQSAAFSLFATLPKYKQMARDGIEPPTHGASIHCSTNWATEPYCGSRIWTYDLRVMSPTSYQLLHPAMIGGGGRIRTFEGKRRQIYSLLPLATREPHHLLEPTIGLEPTTYWLQVSCSTNWATSACSTERNWLYKRMCILSSIFFNRFKPLVSSS